MYLKNQPSRQIPGIISYMKFFSSRKLAYSIFLGTPITLGLFSLLLQTVFHGYIDIFHFIRFITLFLLPSGLGIFFTISFYSKKAPILRAPPKGWAVQINTFFSVPMELTFLFGQVLAIVLDNITYQEVFFILGTIITYIVAFMVYFSFTTVGRPGYLILALVQPVAAILLYSIYTGQMGIDFFVKAMIFFIICALIFAIPYRKGFFKVSNIYKESTGMAGYPFIRAFLLSMVTDGNDDLIENYFDRVGVLSNVKIQYLFIRNTKTKKIKGLFIIPHVHFGPFKTCGSSDLPEHIYRAFKDIPGITVYHTTNDHSQNLTTRGNVETILNRIRYDFDEISKNTELKWISKIKDFGRKISNSAKLIGAEIGNVPIVFITRHPLPSDDIKAEIGENIRHIAISNGYNEIIIIDSHNAIIGDEVLIEKNSLEAQDLINVSRKFILSKKVKNGQKTQMLYGISTDHLKEFSEKDGIGYGGIIVHLFKNTITEQKTALIHFDGNNAYVEIRSNILNKLQNKGIERGEITTSDSHTVARQFSSRGYSPIGDKIKIDIILEKIDTLIQQADNNLEPVEFHYSDSNENVKIWGDPGYFNTILDTLKECIKVSQHLLTLSLIIPTFFSLILLIFLYNI
ncbi:hypothetical protein LCGC14_0740880 [marine sediment metagenome]|uniref:DUF2070 domain-containing protein n=1 Tax=marine sediment metagenome TaxID=412755 RepID=A0A0F9Q6S2_9ZZZZ